MVHGEWSGVVIPRAASGPAWVRDVIRWRLPDRDVVIAIDLNAAFAGLE